MGISFVLLNRAKKQYLDGWDFGVTDSLTCYANADIAVCLVALLSWSEGAGSFRPEPDAALPGTWSGDPISIEDASSLAYEIDREAGVAGIDDWEHEIASSEGWLNAEGFPDRDLAIRHGKSLYWGWKNISKQIQSEMASAIRARHGKGSR